MANNIVDTHVHVWDLERAEYKWLQNDTSILNRTYSIEALSPHIRRANVTEGILVQAANNFEDTDLMLGVADRTEWIKGVVGWLPLQDPVSTEKTLTGRYLKNHYFKGCRHLIHNEPDPRWLLQDSVIESLKILAAHNLSYDVVGVNTDHLRTAIQVAEKLPGLRMVLDHLNQPPIPSNKKFGLWGELMKEAAQYSNVCAKISGLGTTAASGDKWTKDDLKPYVMYALELFGPDRCFCGGDWPVALLAGPYEKAWLAYQEIFKEELALDAQEKVLFKNARRFYTLLN
ncbi:MAG: amidohydrolase family protein [Cyclobacteriaceae bacterium]